MWFAPAESRRPVELSAPPPTLRLLMFPEEGGSPVVEVPEPVAPRRDRWRRTAPEIYPYAFTDQTEAAHAASVFGAQLRSAMAKIDDVILGSCYAESITSGEGLILWRPAIRLPRSHVADGSLKCALELAHLQDAERPSALAEEYRKIAADPWAQRIGLLYVAPSIGWEAYAASFTDSHRLLDYGRPSIQCAYLNCRIRGGSPVLYLTADGQCSF